MQGDGVTDIACDPGRTDNGGRRMSRNQWIGVGTITATILAAVITGGAMVLTDSDEGGVRNDCSNSSTCAGRDINENGR